MAVKKPESTSETSELDFIVIIVLAVFIFSLFGGVFLYFLNPIEALFRVRQFFAPFFEKNLVWLQTISLVLSGLFLWGTLYIMKRVHYIAMKKEQIFDLLKDEYTARYRINLDWKGVLKKLRSRDSNDWKGAILAADNILNEILKMSGYLGIKLEEKLELITPAQLANVEEVKRAHEISSKIVKDPAFEIGQEQAREVVEVYKKSFVELRLLSDLR